MDLNLKKRNSALLLALGGMAILFYCISFIRIPVFGQ